MIVYSIKIPMSQEQRSLNYGTRNLVPTHALFIGCKVVSNNGPANKKVYMAGALFKWFWEETHVPKIVGSKTSTIY